METLHTQRLFPLVALALLSCSGNKNAEAEHLLAQEVLRKANDQLQIALDDSSNLLLNSQKIIEEGAVREAKANEKASRAQDLLDICQQELLLANAALEEKESRRLKLRIELSSALKELEKMAELSDSAAAEFARTSADLHELKKTVLTLSEERRVLQDHSRVLEEQLLLLSGEAPVAPDEWPEMMLKPKNDLLGPGRVLDPYSEVDPYIGKVGIIPNELDGKPVFTPHWVNLQTAHNNQILHDLQGSTVLMGGFVGYIYGDVFGTPNKLSLHSDLFMQSDKTGSYVHIYGYTLPVSMKTKEDLRRIQQGSIVVLAGEFKSTPHKRRGLYNARILLLLNPNPN